MENEKVAQMAGSIWRAIQRVRPFVRCLPGAIPKSPFARELLASAEWLTHTNFVGVALGEKRTSKKRVKGEICLKVYLRSKAPMRRVPTEMRVPAYLRSEAWEGRILTDIEVWPEFPVAQAKLVQPGMSIGLPQVAGGSVGLIVKRRTDGKQALLCCAHVIAPHGSGDLSSIVEQPAAPMVTVLNNRVAEVADFTPILSTGANATDAAIAIFGANANPDPAIPGIGRPDRTRLIVGADFLDSQRLQVVKPKTSVSAQMEGPIEAHQGSIRVRLDTMSITASFDNVVIYRAATAGGDSGSPIMAKGTTAVVGMHIAAHKASGRALFTPIQLALDKMKVDLL